jgi:ClpP class serine protease
MAASAAYWIAAACTKVVVTPSGEVGSIGVYMTHQDVSAAMDKAGVKISFIQAGKYKTDGNPYEPASESFLADAQAGVNEYYEMFVQGVAAGRGVDVEVVKSATFGQGRMLMAKDAVANGMADSIQTLDEVVSELLGADVTVDPVEEPVVAPSDNGVEANLTGSECECDCSDEDCEDTNCDCWEEEDDFEDDDMISAEVTPVVAEEISPEPLSAEAQHEVDENERIAYKVKLMNLY